MVILWTSVAAIVCALLYRMGGIGRPFRSWMRDWMIPIVTGLWMWFVLGAKGPWWAYLLSFGITGGMLTTYWDDLFNGEDNFFMHGFAIGLAYFPFVFTGAISVMGLVARAVLLAILMGFWCMAFSNDWVEECGRGAFIALTLPLLFL